VEQAEGGAALRTAICHKAMDEVMSWLMFYLPQPLAFDIGLRQPDDV
jgi:hypothetical protein